MGCDLSEGSSGSSSSPMPSWLSRAPCSCFRWSTSSPRVRESRSIGSSATIARLWTAHHRLFEPVGAYDSTIVQLTLIWLFTVAFLPLPTAILAVQSGHGAATLYVGTLLASTLASTAAWVRSHPALQRTAESGSALAEHQWTSALLLVVASTLTALVPRASVWPLLLLLLSSPIDAVRRRRSVRTSSRSAV
jgi:uncharacterized membrane protein